MSAHTRPVSNSLGAGGRRHEGGTAGRLPAPWPAPPAAAEVPSGTQSKCQIIPALHFCTCACVHQKTPGGLCTCNLMGTTGFQFASCSFSMEIPTCLYSLPPCSTRPACVPPPPLPLLSTPSSVLDQPPLSPCAFHVPLSAFILPLSPIKRHLSALQLGATSVPVPTFFHSQALPPKALF